jgi:LPS export ABC transporter protein LptC
MGMLFSCGNSDDQINEILGVSSAPDETSEGVTFYYSDEGVVKMKLIAPIIQRFNTEQKMECPKGMIVYFYDSLGVEESRLEALYGMLYSEQQYLFLKDSVVLSSINNRRLETPLLHINFKIDSIYTSERVKITTLDGEIKGRGMFTNSNFTNYEIENIGDSYYYYQSEEEKDE